MWPSFDIHVIFIWLSSDPHVSIREGDKVHIQLSGRHLTFIATDKLHIHLFRQLSVDPWIVNLWFSPALPANPCHHL